MPVSARPLPLAMLAGLGLAAISCTPEHEAPPPRLRGIGPYFHNASDTDVTVQIGLLQGVTLDCTAVSEDPGAYLAAAAFAPPSEHVIAAGNNRMLDAIDSTDGCGAMRLETSDGPQVVFWMGEEVGERHELVVGEPPGPAAIVVTPTRGGVRARNEIGLLYPFADLDPTEGERTCAALPEPGPAWETAPPLGWWMLAEVGQDPRGCARMHLARGEIGTADEERLQWDLCLPDEDFVFEIGDALEFYSESHLLLIRGYAPGAAPYAEPSGIVYKGPVGHGHWPFAALAAERVDEGCTPVRADDCTTVQVPMGLALHLGSAPLATLTPDQPSIETIDADDTTWRVRMERNALYPVRGAQCDPPVVVANDAHVFVTRRSAAAAREE